MVRLCWNHFMWDFRLYQITKLSFSNITHFYQSLKRNDDPPLNEIQTLNDLPVQSLKRNDDPPQIISIAPISQLSLFISKNTPNSYLLAQEPSFRFDSMLRWSFYQFYNFDHILCRRLCGRRLWRVEHTLAQH